MDNHYTILYNTEDNRESRTGEDIFNWCAAYHDSSDPELAEIAKVLLSVYWASEEVYPPKMDAYYYVRPRNTMSNRTCSKEPAYVMVRDVLRSPRYNKVSLDEPNIAEEHSTSVLRCLAATKALIERCNELTEESSY